MFNKNGIKGLMQNSHELCETTARKVWTCKVQIVHSILLQYSIYQHSFAFGNCFKVTVSRANLKQLQCVFRIYSICIFTVIQNLDWPIFLVRLSIYLALFITVYMSFILSYMMGDGAVSMFHIGQKLRTLVHWIWHFSPGSLTHWNLGNPSSVWVETPLASFWVWQTLTSNRFHFSERWHRKR